MPKYCIPPHTCIQKVVHEQLAHNNLVCVQDHSLQADILNNHCTRGAQQYTLAQVLLHTWCLLLASFCKRWQPCSPSTMRVGLFIRPHRARLWLQIISSRICWQGMDCATNQRLTLLSTRSTWTCTMKIDFRF